MLRHLSARQCKAGAEHHHPMINVHTNTVYVVDDDEAVLDSIQVLLESAGFSVRAFSSAADFLKDASALRAACLITDIHMPRIGGFELLERIKANGASIPTIMISGRSDATLDRRAKRLGALVVLQKPVDDDELLIIVRSILALPQP